MSKHACMCAFLCMWVNERRQEERKEGEEEADCYEEALVF